MTGFSHPPIHSLWIYTMNRCLIAGSMRILAAQLALGLGLAMGPALAIAQSPSPYLQPQRIPPISAKAMRGTLRIVQPPEVLLNGQPARLAPGARIRDRNNLMVVSGALIGQDLPVRYTRDPLGLVHEVWVLTAAETAADPMPQSFSAPQNTPPAH